MKVSPVSPNAAVQRPHADVSCDWISRSAATACSASPRPRTTLSEPTGNALPEATRKKHAEKHDAENIGHEPAPDRRGMHSPNCHEVMHSHGADGGRLKHEKQRNWNPGLQQCHGSIAADNARTKERQ